MKTREKILETALRLFNEHGVPNVTLRRIAAEMAISQGNLNYHFKKREDIIEALYYQLLMVFEEEKAKLDTHEMDMAFIFASTRSGMEALYRFRFLMIDFNQNMRENPAIHQHFIQLEQIRKVTYLKAFDIAISKGIMRKPEFDNEYEDLIDTIRVFSDYWIASSEIYRDASATVVDKYHKLLVELFYPYFTETAKSKFLSERT